jgi:hypothetical protein
MTVNQYHVPDGITAGEPIAATAHAEAPFSLATDLSRFPLPDYACLRRYPGWPKGVTQQVSTERDFNQVDMSCHRERDATMREPATLRTSPSRA